MNKIIKRIIRYIKVKRTLQKYPFSGSIEETMSYVYKLIGKYEE